MSTDKIREFERELPVRLNDGELQTYGKMLADKVKERSAVDEKRKAVNKGYQAQIAKIDEEANRLADARSKGEELRMVRCQERWRAGVVEVIRLDTMAVCDVRPATPDDRQPDLFDTGADGSVLDDGPRGDALVADGAMTTSSYGDQVYYSPDDADSGATPVDDMPDTVGDEEAAAVRAEASGEDPVFAAPGEMAAKEQWTEDQPSLPTPTMSAEIGGPERKSGKDVKKGKAAAKKKGR